MDSKGNSDWHRKNSRPSGRRTEITDLDEKTIERHMYTARVTTGKIKDLNPIERAKRMMNIKEVTASISRMEDQLLKVDSEEPWPLLGVQLATTITNVVMINPNTLYTPEEVTYTDNLSLISIQYRNWDTNVWIRAEITTEGGEVNLRFSDSPEVWPNVSIADIMHAMEVLYTEGRSPGVVETTTPVEPPTAPVDETPSL